METTTGYRVPRAGVHLLIAPQWDGNYGRGVALVKDTLVAFNRTTVGWKLSSG